LNIYSLPAIFQIGRFPENLTIDCEIYLETIQRKGSFRDIVMLINMELAKQDIPCNNVLTPEQRYTQLHEIGCSYPIEYLLFDFCLALLDEDYLDAGLYLAHSFHILDLCKSFNLLLSVIVNEQLAYDRHVRELLILITRTLEPRNTEAYIDTYTSGFRKRYKMYKEEPSK
jgi:hypothetical protein